MELQSLNTPAALIDVERMTRNIERMQHRLNALGVSFRPHVKTTKCNQVVQAQIDAGARGITVSTLKEAEQFFASGVRDIVYAVGMAPVKLPQALALRRQGCALKIVADIIVCAQPCRRSASACGTRRWRHADRVDDVTHAGSQRTARPTLGDAACARVYLGPAHLIAFGGASQPGNSRRARSGGAAHSANRRCVRHRSMRRGSCATPRPSTAPCDCMRECWASA